jgi:hypothetical protein|tara:strand:- start:452 stop:1051 length:600 start_codon:yes stop_codon:yes gene_type:complete
LVSSKIKKLIYTEVRLWSKHYLEVPNKHLNKMPACPFAAKAWMDSKVDIVVRNPQVGYVRELHKHVKNINFNKKEILIYCDVYFKEYGLNKFQRIIDNFNRKYNKKDVYFMGFHPYNPPNEEEQEFLLDPTGDISNLPDSKIDFSMMLIQKFSQLYEASDKLHRMGYYDKWPRDYYHEVVSSRQKQFKKLFKGDNKCQE